MTDTTIVERELKKGSTELLTLSLLEERQRHGYEIRKLIAVRSDGFLRLHVASLYPLLYRLESRGLIQGRWIERAGERRRRFYRITPKGRKVLAAQRGIWQQFAAAINRVTGLGHA
jgi:transcriptional regulator